MALDELLEAIEDEARCAIRAELERGRGEASRIAAEAEARALRTRAESLRCEEERVARELEPELSIARLSARREVAEARRRLAARVLQEMERQIPRVVLEERYLETLPRQLEESLTYLGEVPVQVRATPAIAACLEGIVKTRPRVSVESDPSVMAGFRLLTWDGAFVLDATLDSALARRRRELEIEILRRWGIEHETHVG